MSTNIPKNIGDKRQLYAEDQANQRRIQLKNLAREDAEAQVRWRQKQMDLYNNMITVTQSPTMAQIITSQYKGDQYDPEVEMQRGLANLLKISSTENAEYILDRLEPDDIYLMNLNFAGVVRDIQKNNKTLDKKIFISRVKQLKPEAITDTPLSAQGQLNLDALTERQIAQENARLAQEKEFDDTQGAMERLADYNTELKEQKRLDEIAKQNARLARTQLFQNRYRTRSAAVALSLQNYKSPVKQLPTTTPLKTQEQLALATAPVIQPLQTTKISVQEATTPPSQSTGPSNKIQGDSAGEKTDIGNLGQIENISYTNLKPYLEKLHEKFPKADDIKQYITDNFGPSYLKGLDNKKLTKTELYTMLAEEQYRKDKLREDIAKASPVKTSPKQVNLDIQDEKIVGDGLKRVKRIIGRGKPHLETTLSKRKYISNDKFYIDIKKLNDNILSVKYSKTDSNIPSLKSQSISTDLKELIQDSIEGNYDNRIFKKLNDTDKRIFKRFCSVCKINEIEIDDPYDEAFQQRFEILKGEYLSGNSSPQNKNELKRYILEAHLSNKIPRSEAMMLLYEISL